MSDPNPHESSSTIACATAVPEKRPFPFLDLPAELRIEVCTYLSPYHQAEPDFGKPIYIDFLLTCK
jgi:hypothetical protein